VSLGSLFSSPGKQAQQAGSAQQALSQNEINQAENYVNNSEQNERNAIAGLGTNPYFGSGGSSPLPAPTKLNPSDVNVFGPNGSTGAAPSSSGGATLPSSMPPASPISSPNVFSGGTAPAPNVRRPT
jgi:hypothetical protein